MKILALIVLVVAIVMLSSNAFGETEYVDEKRNFSITLPEGWISGEEPKADYSWTGVQWNWRTFYKQGDIEPYNPIISIGYSKDNPGYIEPLCLGWNYRPDGYENDMHCKGLENREEKYYNEGENEIYEIKSEVIWESDWRSVIKKQNFFSKSITNGIETWAIRTSYDHDSLYEFPNLQEEIKPMIQSFNPILCKDHNSTRISLEGETNPLIGSRNEYQLTVENAMDGGRLDAGVYGIDGKQFNSNNKKNTHAAQVVSLRGSSDFFITDVKFHYMSSTFVIGDTTIYVVNGCYLFQFPITIRDENWKETEVISVVPAWVKNNAGWWAEETIDDDAFIQAIQFLIKEDIISIDSVASSFTESAKIVPAWVKNNAGWWAEGQIDDNSFVKGIEYLVKVGIIQVS